MITEKEKTEIVKEAKKIKKWFQIDIKISILGQEIVHWIYPPEKQ